MSNRIENIQLPPISDFYPPNTENDDEFWGDPWTHVQVQLLRRVQNLDVNIYASFTEGKGDYSVFQGQDERNVFNCDVEYPGWRLASLVGEQDLIWSWEGTLRGFGNHYIRVGETGLVNHAVLHGDEYGGWFGGPDHPAVLEIAFNPVAIELYQDAPEAVAEYREFRKFVAARRDAERAAQPADLSSVRPPAATSKRPPAAASNRPLATSVPWANLARPKVPKGTWGKPGV